MNNTPVTELALYRYRYFISYTLLAILAIGLLTLNLSTLPPGITAGEQASAITSSQITFTFHPNTFGSDILHFLRTTDTVNLPYHLLQKLSLQFLGLSALGVRLPSLVIAIASIFMFFGLIKRWLHDNIAVVVGLLVATSSWFISVGRIGTPDIMVIFWTTLIIFLATLASQESRYYRIWKALSLVCIGLSLYTPYTIYLFIAAAIATITQPHLRYIVHYASKASVTVGAILFAIILVPLGFSLWNNSDTIWQLLGVSAALPDPMSFLKSFGLSLSALFNPFETSFAIVPRPLIALPIAALTAVGFFCLLKEWHSVRSHVLLIWTAILLPLVGLDTTHNLIVLFVPVMLLGAIGIQWTIAYWYTIFPRNPYARVFGLLPIGLLLFSIIQFNYLRYFEGIPFAPTTVSLYNQDPFILTDTISSKSYNDQRLVLIVPTDKIELYRIDQTITANLTVVTPNDFTSASDANRVIVATDSLPLLTPAQQALLPTGKSELLVNDRKNDGLRFRVYSAL